MEKHTYFKWGGIAALAEAASFLVGFAVFLAVLAPARYADPTLALGDQLAFLSHNHTWLYGWYFVIYILFGIVLVILVISLHELLAPSANWMSIASIFGLLWAGLVIASGMVVNTGIAFIVEHAQTDAALPIGYGKTLSKPSTVAFMLNALDLEGGEQVLEVGSGSGYVLALLAELGARTLLEIGGSFPGCAMAVCGGDRFGIPESESVTNAW